MARPDRRPLLSRRASSARTRRVSKVVVAYAVASWVVIQVASTVFPALSIPRAAVTAVVVVAIAGLPLAALWAWFSPSRLEPEAPAMDEDAPALPVGPSIAVLPFSDPGSNQDATSFADGLTDELITALARIDGLHVAARTSVFALRAEVTDVRAIARRLRVGNVLEGSIRSTGERLRITVQLVNAANGYVLWSERYDRDSEDIFAIQDEIARAIVTALLMRLEVGRMVEPATTVPAAYAFYLQGLQARGRGGEVPLREALAHFKQASRLDPSFAAAHAALAETYIDLGQHTYLEPREAYRQADLAVARALALDPRLAGVHVARGRLALHHDWDLAAAGAAFEEALRLAPGDAGVHLQLARLRMLTGDSVRAEMHARKALSLDPLAPLAVAALAAVLQYGRRPQEAIALLQPAVAQRPEHFPYLYRLGFAQAEAGDGTAAVETAEHAAQVDGDSPFALALLGYAYARAGQASEAASVLDRMERMADTRYVCPYDLAVIHAALGESDSAFAWLDRAYTERDHALLGMRVDPAMDPLRGDCRFESLAVRVGLPQGTP